MRCSIYFYGLKKLLVNPYKILKNKDIPTEEDAVRLMSKIADETGCNRT